jgi:hypothetical protein
VVRQGFGKLKNNIMYVNYSKVNSVGFSAFKKDLKFFLLKHSFYTIN